MVSTAQSSSSPALPLERSETLRRLSGLVGVQTARELWGRPPVFPVDLPLAPVFGSGGLPQGCTVSCTGSMAFSFVVAAIARATREHHWCATVGVGTPAVSSLLDYGVDLDSYVNIATEPADWLRAVSILIDSFAIVVVRPGFRLTPAEHSRLSAKVRGKQMTLLVLGDFAATHERIEVDRPQWSGLSGGAGRLEQCRVTVRSSATGIHELILPAGDGGIGS